MIFASTQAGVQEEGEMNPLKIRIPYHLIEGVRVLERAVGGTGVIGVLRGGLPGGKTILFRADLDGLPIQEVMSGSGGGAAAEGVDAEGGMDGEGGGVCHGNERVGAWWVMSVGDGSQETPAAARTNCRGYVNERSQTLCILCYFEHLCTSPMRYPEKYSNI
jgi:hypothetical protein